MTPPSPLPSRTQTPSPHPGTPELAQGWAEALQFRITHSKPHTPAALGLSVIGSLGSLNPSSQEADNREEGVAQPAQGCCPPAGHSHRSPLKDRLSRQPPPDPPWPGFLPEHGRLDTQALRSGKPRTVGTRTSGQHVPALPPPPVTQPPQAPLDTMCWPSHGGRDASPALTVDTQCVWLSKRAWFCPVPPSPRCSGAPDSATEPPLSLSSPPPSPTHWDHWEFL